ncbi:hypothetical protein BBP40_009677 [Aspergillus hancockii]|nr:hypothetical protein BBP40_009677 [Aspergillus hancockii]
MDAPGDVPSQPDKTQLREQDRVTTYPVEENDSVDDNGLSLMQSEGLSDTIIHFLATSSNETLLGVFACLICATYILLGRVGLLLIGVASGIVLHASWEGMGTQLTGNKCGYRYPNWRKEVALNMAHRLLDWPRHNPTGVEAKNDTSKDRLLKDTSMKEPDYSAFRPETAAALRSLTQAVISNYVNYWYEPILPSETTFPSSCRVALTSFITSASTHLSRKRTADTFLEILTNSSSMIIVFLTELSKAFETVGPSLGPEETVQRYLELFPDSSLANVLEVQQQRKKLNLIADDMLSRFLDPMAYAFPPLRDFLREILGGVVLESTISNLSRPAFINGWIVHLFSEGESEIMSAIDAGVEGARNQGVATGKDSSDMNAPVPTPADNMKSDIKQTPGVAQKDNASIDKATEEAMVEAKRLSAMIAAQDFHHQNVDVDNNNSQGSVATDDENADLQSCGRIETNGEISTTQMGLESINAELIQKIHEPACGKVLLSNTARWPSYPSSLPSTSSLASSQPSENVLPTSLALYCATISVDSASEPGDKGLLRSKPTSDYLLQIEPVSARCTGWMVFRKYTDFESLHETLATISRLNRLQKFTNDHAVIPSWKGQTKQSLARDLQRYLQNALQYESLAESERMKRFLEKDERFGADSVSAHAKTGFSFPGQVSLENVGKGVLGVLANAPKGVSNGSKAVFGGVTGVFGAASVKKTPSDLITGCHSQKIDGPVQPNESCPRSSEDARDPKRGRVSLELDNALEDTPSPFRRQRPSSPLFDATSGREVVQGAGPCESQDATAGTRQMGPSSLIYRDCGLPEPSPSSGVPEEWTMPAGQDSVGNRGSPITEEETRIAVELIFAVINELYTLSSAWNIRRTLLNAAKSYILRPGNPNLETIRNLLQGSMIESNTSDEALGMYINKLRENILPTEAEQRSWPPAPNYAENERLRVTARKALVQKGLPQTLTSVMGAAASREALEKVFDSLQVPVIARGLVFSVLLQALRAVIF